MAAAVHFTGVANATAVQAGVATHGVALAATKTPYAWARIIAMTPGSAATQPPTANAGAVYVATSDAAQYAQSLTPGQTGYLPPYGDLANFFLMVTTANDGVLIVYA